MKKPNFFIVGAPKCGTTAMATWLSQHKSIKISTQKELYYFDDDQSIGDITSLDEYLNHFDKTNQNHLAVGEASVTYLTSNVAVRNILSFNPDAKFIVMFRNPLEMAMSLHAELLWDGWECIEDFELAWRERKNIDLGTRLSGPYCTYTKFLDYEFVCKVGAQIERLLKVAPRKQVLFINMDDLKLDPLLQYRRVLEFLNVPYDGRVLFKTINSRKIPISRFLRVCTRRLFDIKSRVGLRRLSFGLLNLIDNFNRRKAPLSRIRPEFKMELVDVFKSDVQMLSVLYGQDLSHWLK